MEQSRAVVVSTACAETELIDHVDEEGYPLVRAFRAFMPLLARWGSLIEVTRPESRLDHALWRAHLHHQEPLHLSFLPLGSTYLAQRAVSFAFSFCAYPGISDMDLASNPRRNSGQTPSAPIAKAS
jgi:hypothetical protein